MCQLRPRLPDIISQLSDDHGPADKHREDSYNPNASILSETIGELRSENIQIRTENIRIRSEASEIRLENIHLLSELNDVRNSVMYRHMRSLASKIDILFPDGTTRGAIRKRIVHRLRAGLSLQK
jgi:hypothetical protein